MTRPLLVRIPWSHFCQKAEWSLTQAGIEYDAIDIGLKGMVEAERICPSGLVPVMYLEDQILDGSQAIARWAEAHAAPGTLPLRCGDPDVAAWEAWADDELGPATRREAYRVLHASPFAADVPLVVKLLSRAGRGVILNVLKYYKTRRYDDSDAALVPAAIDKIATALHGRPFLTGDEPTVADHAVAALAKPLLYVENARHLPDQPGWDAVTSFIARVEPPRTTLQRKHWIRARDWHALEGQRERIEKRGEEAEKETIVA